jgi:tetratricopeptide (TPR) repeat protein/TolB-like protein
VLFTDIVGSTERAAELGDSAWRDLLRKHHAIVRRELRRFSGREAATTGDGFLATFDRPERAIVCAWAVRAGLRELGIEIRAGLHLGGVEVVEHTVGGIAVHTAARVADDAGAGEVLVSSTVRDAVAGSGFGFEERGVHRLKGVPGEWRLFAVASLGRAPRQPWLARLPVTRAMLGALIACVLLLGLGVWFVLNRDRGRSLGPGEIVAAPGPGLAVLPFRVVGPNMELWREGMVDLLSTNLDGAAGIRTIAPRTLLSRWRRTIGAEAEASDPEALQVARAVGAKHALIGSMVALGGEVRLTAKVYDLESGELEGESLVRGPPDSIPALVDRLSIEILGAALAREPSGLPRLDLRRVTTTSLPALKAYLAGEQDFRHSRWGEAIADYTRAVEADSTFALALAKLANAYGWTGDYSRIVETAERAARFADRLPEREALFVRGDSEFNQRNGSAIQTLERFTTRYPDEPEGWYALGEVYLHLGGQEAYPHDKWRYAFRRALALDPDFGPPYIHLFMDAVVQRDSVGAEQLLSRYRQIDPASPSVRGIDLAYALVWGDRAKKQRARGALDTLETSALFEAWIPLMMTSDFWQEAIWTSEALLGERHPLVDRQLAGRIISSVYLRRGRLREAREAASEVPGQEPSNVEGSNLLLVWQLMGLGDGTTAQRAADALAADTTALARLLVGAFAADMQRWEDVEREVQALEPEPPRRKSRQGEGEAIERSGFAQALRGYAAARRGDERLAIQELSQALPKIPSGWYSAGPQSHAHDHAHAALRYRLGKLLFDQDELREAERYFRSVELYYDITPVEFYLGRIDEERGNLEEARLHYARFVRWWQDCDPELRPMWEEGRQALARISAVARL